MDRPTASPPYFPFRQHRTMAEVDGVSSPGVPLAKLADLWIDGFWPHMRNKRNPEGRWFPSRWNSRRRAWMFQTARTQKVYPVLSGPARGRVLTNPPDWLDGPLYAVPGLGDAG